MIYYFIVNFFVIVYNGVESEEVMKTEFNVKVNFTVFLFLSVYLAYTIFLLITQNMSAFLSVFAVGVVLYVYFLGFRPYKYIVDKKTLYFKYRLRKAKEVPLVECETICDPVERFSEFMNRPHAIEIYTNAKKRYCCFPKDRVGFVEAIVRSNKRIHCTVKDYTDVHRQLERKLRKEKRKAEKKAAKEKESK